MDLRAVVIGSTGLVGSALVQLLLADARFGGVVSLVRRPSGVAHPKLVEHVVDFGAPDVWAPFVAGDILYAAMGTTLRAAGSQAAQYEVDYTFQYRAAELAAKAHVSTYALVSSVGANPTSRVFYSRIKGELERDVRALGFRRVCIVRPSFLVGRREVGRPGEAIGVALARGLRWLPGLERYRPIEADTVARALVATSLGSEDGCVIHESEELFGLAAA